MTKKPSAWNSYMYYLSLSPSPPPPPSLSLPFLVLQFSLAARMRLAISSKSKNAQYPQPEGALGDAWIKVGTELDDTPFGKYSTNTNGITERYNGTFE